jgi:hypothetical protein
LLPVIHRPPLPLMTTPSSIAFNVFDDNFRLSFRLLFLIAAYVRRCRLRHRTGQLRLTAAFDIATGSAARLGIEIDHVGGTNRAAHRVSPYIDLMAFVLDQRIPGSPITGTLQSLVRCIFGSLWSMILCRLLATAFTLSPPITNSCPSSLAQIYLCGTSP